MFFTTPPTPPTLPQPITVWVHGSRTSHSYAPILSKQLNELQHRIFHVENGLNRAADIDPYFYMHHLARTVSQARPEKYPFQTFYLFGWNGELDPISRKAAGIELYNSLKQVVTLHTHNGIIPPITLFTHSHGGNVVLNMKHAFDMDSNPLHIDKAIFIACPVQQETKEFVSCPLFKDLHSYHSDSDVLQRIDPQRMHPLMTAAKKAKETKSIKPFKGVFSQLWHNKCPLFSERHFAPNPKIKQACISWRQIKPWSQEEIAIFKPYTKQVTFYTKLLKKRRPLTHLEFMMPTFLQQLPNIVDKADAHAKISYCPKHPDVAIEL